MMAPDELSYLGAASEIQKQYNKDKEQVFWTNALLGGMPTYQIEKIHLGWNPIQFLKSALGLFTAPMLSYFIGLSLLGFIVLCCFGISPYLSCIGAFALTYTTDHIILAMVGHYTKLEAIMYLSLIIGGITLIFRDRLVLGFILFTAGLLFNLQANHLQMTYYIFIIGLVIVIITAVKAYQENHLKLLVKPILLLILGVGIALLGNIAHLYSTYNYAKETIRGERILAESTTILNDPSATSGLDWTYASEYSNGFMDLVAMIIPRAIGGSSSERVQAGSKVAAEYKRKDAQNTPSVPLYWGELPSNDGPNYVGIVSFLFFLLGAFYIKGSIKYWAVVSFVVLILQSLGHNFFINKFLFDYFPFYNSFRAPNSILLIATAVVPLFGFYALYQILQDKWTTTSILALYKKSVFPLLGFLFVILMSGFLVFDYTRPDEVKWGDLSSLISTRRSYLTRDTWRAILLVSGASLILYLVLKNKIKQPVFLSAIGMLMILDLWPVGNRYMFVDDFKDQKEIQKSLKMRNADQVILRDRELSFRVFDLTENPFSSSKSSMYHKSVGGYHPAKLRRYQDIIDTYLSKGHTGVVNMLNTKYIINPSNLVTKNEEAHGNAWFIDSVIKVSTPDQEFRLLENINLTKSAIVLADEFPDYIDSSTFLPNGSIRLTTYTPNKLTYQTNSSNNQLAVFSEIWYGPNKGWQAYIDGLPVPHIRANYILRALKVPAGLHKIEFEFYPTIVWSLIKINGIILWIISFALIGGLGYLFFKNIGRR